MGLCENVDCGGSGRGSCDSSTGNCVCKGRYYGESCESEAPSTCVWENGSGEPGTNREKVGEADSAAECILMVKRANPNANGATYPQDPPGNCYAEIGKTGVNLEHEGYWRTCTIVDPNSNPGDVIITQNGEQCRDSWEFDGVTHEGKRSIILPNKSAGAAHRRRLDKL